MSNERFREPETKTSTPPPGAPLPMTPATDVATLADAALAPVAVAPAAITVTVKTTAGAAATIVATPDTPIAEVMTQACTALGVRDRRRHLLVANGQVLGDLQRTLGDVATTLADGLTMRLVTRPEAGREVRAWRC
jgi:hypothetical protein